MNRERIYPGWLLGLLSVGPWLMIILFVVASIALFVLSRNLEDRLDNIEESIAHEMPPKYEMLDLADHLAVGLDAAALTHGALVYVPVYSHIYVAGGRPYLLETTLSIRNTDPEDPVYLDSVTYYDTKGNPVKTYVDEVIRLAPLESIEFVVEQRDIAGGAGANFLVQWKATAAVEPPLIEAVMAGVVGAQAISFAREGRVLGGAR